MKATCDIVQSILNNTLLTDEGKVKVIQTFLNGEDVGDLFITCPHCKEVMTDCFCEIPTTLKDLTVQSIPLEWDAIEVGDFVTIKTLEEIKRDAVSVYDYDGWMAYAMDSSEWTAVCFNDDMVEFCGNTYEVSEKGRYTLQVKNHLGKEEGYKFTLNMLSAVERH